MTTHQESLYEEIDLRPYIGALLNRWYWIVGSAIVAGILAFLVTSFLPPRYEATTLVAITSPRYTLQFDPRIQTLEDTPAYSAFPDLATSDDLMFALYAEVSDSVPDIESPFGLRDVLSAAAAGDQSLLRLTVTLKEPDVAAQIANVWAELFVVEANRIYGSSSEDSLLFLSEQLTNAEAELTAVQDQLIEFQSRNRGTIIQNRLNARIAIQAENLEEQRITASVIQDAQGMLAQFTNGSTNRTVTAADQLTSLLLQAQAVTVYNDSEFGSPLQFQIGGANSVTALTVEEQVAFLEGLITSLEAKREEVSGLLDEIEPLILEDQQTLQAIESEGQFLSNQQDIVQQTYLTLARKVEEAQIASQDTEGVVQLASQAAIPENALGQNQIITAVLGGIVGALSAIFFLFIKAWWLTIYQ